MSWGVYEVHDSLHVIPDFDLKPHDHSTTCNCGYVYECGVYIHNSYDERELTEGLKKS